MLFCVTPWLDQPCCMARFIRHCEKNYIVIRRSNPVKNSDLQNFFYYFF
ncbi:hypothetical protein [Rickettsia felis]|nr:hypothetical protein [Rickettsia felis]